MSDLGDIVLLKGSFCYTMGLWLMERGEVVHMYTYQMENKNSRTGEGRYLVSVITVILPT